MEMMEELQDEKDQFELVLTDQRAMELLVKISQNKAAAVIETQRYLIKRNAEKVNFFELEQFNTGHLHLDLSLLINFIAISASHRMK